MKPGLIYFAAIGLNGPVKIGFTSKAVADRIADIQGACPWKIEIIGSISGTRIDEAAIHSLLRSHRMQGEWFSRSPQVCAEIDRILTSGFKWPEYTKTVIDRAIEFAGSQCALSNAIGCSQAAISLARLGRRVKPETALAIHQYTKGEISASDLRPDLWRSPLQVPGCAA